MASLRRLLPRFSLRTLAIFPLLVTCVAGLRLHWNAWSVNRVFRGQFSGLAILARFADDESKIEIVTVPYADDFSDYTGRYWQAFPRTVHAFDAETGKPSGSRKIPAANPKGGDPLALVGPLWHLMRRDETIARDCRRIVALDYGSRYVEIHNARDWHTLCQVLTPERNGPVVGEPAIDFYGVRDFVQRICAFSGDGNQILVVAPDSMIYMLRRRRPEWWWGVFYLWEFWLTVAFAGLLLWSILRDRKALALASVTHSPLVGEGGDGG